MISKSSVIRLSILGIILSGMVSANIENQDVVVFDNLTMGTPSKADTIIDRQGYALGYSEKHEQPLWVTYKLTSKEVKTKVAKRKDDFRADLDIPTGSASLADYRRSGHDRGHLAPAADMAWSVKAMSESFYMSNMTPQKPSFNRGIWSKLESLVRHNANVEDEVYVVTGGIFTDEDITIGTNKVTVPHSYYKVIYDTTPPRKMIGFILPNKGSKEPLKSFAVTVDVVEQRTELDFFSLVPDGEVLESTLTVDAWKF